jgi:hypothetical protein
MLQSKADNTGGCLETDCIYVLDLTAVGRTSQKSIPQHEALSAPVTPTIIFDLFQFKTRRSSVFRPIMRAMGECPECDVNLVGCSSLQAQIVISAKHLFF